LRKKKNHQNNEGSDEENLDGLWGEMNKIDKSEGIDESER